MLHFHVHPKSACCSRVRRGLEACLHILLPILGFLWREAFSGFSFFKACSFQGWAFAWSWAFPPSAHSLALFYSLYVSCHTVLLFLLWCYLTEAYWASLGLLLILPSMTQYSHLGFLVTLLVGSYVPFFFWASLAHLLSFGLLALFLTLHSHVLLLTPLGFLGPITLSLILGAHGLAINPLLSLLALLWAYYGSFSLFYITYCPWVCHFSLSPSSFRPIYFLKAHFFISWACDPLFLLLGLSSFSIHSLTLCCSCCWTSSLNWASQNGHQQ